MQQPQVEAKSRLDTGFICDSQEAEVLRSSLVDDEDQMLLDEVQPKGPEQQLEEEGAVDYLSALADDGKEEPKESERQDTAKCKPKEKQLRGILARLDELEDKAKCQLQHKEAAEKEMRYVRGLRRLYAKRQITWEKASFQPDHPAKWVDFHADEDQKGDECPICSRDFFVRDDVAQLSCGHVFCRDCFATAWKEGHRVCPCCRQAPARE